MIEVTFGWLHNRNEQPQCALHTNRRCDPKFVWNERVIRAQSGCGPRSVPKFVVLDISNIHNFGRIQREFRQRLSERSAWAIAEQPCYRLELRAFCNDKAYRAAISLLRVAKNVSLCRSFWILCSDVFCSIVDQFDGFQVNTKVEFYMDLVYVVKPIYNWWMLK